MSTAFDDKFTLSVGDQKPHKILKLVYFLSALNTASKTKSID